jgi:hypothetical protein
MLASIGFHLRQYFQFLSTAFLFKKIILGKELIKRKEILMDAEL